MNDIIEKPGVTGIACAVAATALGIGYMAAADAPEGHLIFNGGALVIGLLLYAALNRLPGRGGGAVTVAIGLVLLATALFGVSADGATRWASVGPILLQPSLILLPMLAVIFARARGWTPTAGVGLAATALAIQPDRAMAGALAVSLAAILLARPDRQACVALSMAAAAFAVTLLRPDQLPAVPFVDGILYSAFDVHLISGLAVVAGSALLILPAILARQRAGQRDTSVAFGAMWSAIIAAAALGNYPTPLVGYGGSAVIGYLLSLAMFPRALSASTAGRHSGQIADGGVDEGPLPKLIAAG